MASWVKTRWEDEQISWDELWVNMANLVSLRSRCSRDRVGAVLVSQDNVMLGAGYNGAPPPYPTVGWCDTWCERAISSKNGGSLHPNYDDCPASHAEVSCIMRAPHFSGSAVLYVNSPVCWQCAKFIAASPAVKRISKVIMQVEAKDRHRDPGRTVDFLTECGIDVAIWSDSVSSHMRVFIDHNGLGPHRCHFCDVVMSKIEVVHHLDHDHSNNDPTNLTAAHDACHSSYHGSHPSRGGNGPHQRVMSPRRTITKKWERVKPLLKCDDCDLETTPGWLKRHGEIMSHTVSEYVRWHQRSVDERDARLAATKSGAKTCECGLVTSAHGMAVHRRASGHHLA